MNAKRGDIATWIMVICAVVVTVIIVHREFFPTAVAAEAETQPRPVDNWSEIAATGQRMGPERAPMQIVEFSDFQCPFCATFAATLRKVRAKYPDRVAVLYRHFPLDALHPHARTAALASECAGEQGRFEAYHDRLFAQQDSIGTKPWARFAAEAGLPDTVAFNACVASQRLLGNVDRDAELGKRSGVHLTPTLVIDGTLIPGTVSETELEEWITGRKRER